MTSSRSSVPSGPRARPHPASLARQRCLGQRQAGLPGQARQLAVVAEAVGETSRRTRGVPRARVRGRGELPHREREQHDADDRVVEEPDRAAEELRGLLSSSARSPATSSQAAVPDVGGQRGRLGVQHPRLEAQAEPRSRGSCAPSTSTRRRGSRAGRSSIRPAARSSSGRPQSRTIAAPKTPAPASVGLDLVEDRAPPPSSRPSAIADMASTALSWATSSVAPSASMHRDRLAGVARVASPGRRPAWSGRPAAPGPARRSRVRRGRRTSASAVRRATPAPREVTGFSWNWLDHCSASWRTRRSGSLAGAPRARRRGRRSTSRAGR